MEYSKLLKKLIEKAEYTFMEKTSTYKGEFEEYTKEAIWELLSSKVEKLGISMDISQTMFEQDIVDALNWLIFLYGKRTDEINRSG